MELVNILCAFGISRSSVHQGARSTHHYEAHFGSDAVSHGVAGIQEGFNISDFRIIMMVKNTGSVNATLDHCHIDGNRWNVFRPTSCAAEGRTVGGPRGPTYTLTPE